MFASTRDLLLIVAAFHICLISPTLAATFPLPPGPFNTSLVISQLTDHTRLDPYAPTPTPRSLMVSIFHPATCIAGPQSYMEHISAAWTDSEFASYGIPASTFESLYLQTCPPPQPCRQASRVPHAEIRNNNWKTTAYPLLLFSPGLGNLRLDHSILAQSVASRGYTVVTIDHPYDAKIVVYPDNSTVLAANISTDQQIVSDLYVRVKDISFVLDQLSRPSIVHSLLPDVEINTKKVGIFGHSLGGATAAQAMVQDPRLVGGINLDGTFFGSVVKAGLSSPFLIFAHEGKNITTDPSWNAIWPKLIGFKHILELNGSTHGTFLDFSTVIDVLGFKDQLPPEVVELLGSIDGMRALQIVGTYVSAFFDKVLKGKRTTLLNGPNEAFPEVTFEDL